MSRATFIAISSTPGEHAQAKSRRNAFRRPLAPWPIAALLLTAFSTGCAKPDPPRIVTRIEHVEVRHPDHLLVCLDEPAQPPEPRTVQQGLDWIAGVRAAGQDCRAALACIRARQVREACE